MWVLFLNCLIPSANCLILNAQFLIPTAMSTTIAQMPSASVYHVARHCYAAIKFFGRDKKNSGSDSAAGPDGAYVVEIVGPGKMGLEYKYRVGG